MDIQDFFQQNSRVAVAFSGGVDSSVLLLLAKRYAQNVKAYYVRSPFQPLFEYEDAVRIAELLQVPLDVITVDILQNKEVAANPADRCYYCKKAIFNAICAHAEKDGLLTVIEGTNASDDIGDRPGFRALQELGILSPLRECGYTKAQIRALAKEHGLPVADKPSYACLATRIPTGTLITKERLAMTEQAETALREMGFVNFRVRYDSGAARLELSRRDFEQLLPNRQHILAALLPHYKDVYLCLRERADE